MDTKERTHLYDDEIDLFELASVVWSKRIFIAVFVAVVSLLAVGYSLHLKNIYESKAVLKPTQSSNQPSLGGLGALAGFAGINIGGGDSVFADINILIRDQKLIAEFIKKNNFQEKLLGNTEIMKTERFMKNENSILYKTVSSTLKVIEDKSTKYITVTFENEDPKFAQEFLNAFLEEISNLLKRIQMGNIDTRIDNYKNEISKATDLTLKTRLSELVATLIQNKVLANADEYYGFTIISGPTLSDLENRVSPKRSQICIIAFVTSFILAVFLAILINFIKNYRQTYLQNRK